MVACLSNPRLNDGAFVTQAFLGPTQGESQLGHVMAAASAELNALAGVPDALVGVELRRIPRQLLQMQPLGGAPPQEVLDRLATRNGRALPDHEYLVPDRAQQQAQEPDDSGRAGGVVLRLQEEAPVGREAADGRELV